MTPADPRNSTQLPFAPYECELAMLRRRVMILEVAVVLLTVCIAALIIGLGL